MVSHGNTTTFLMQCHEVLLHAATSDVANAMSHGTTTSDLNNSMSRGTLTADAVTVPYSLPWQAR